MKNLFSAACALLAALAMPGAHAGGISDVGVNGYWGADGHNQGDVIGGSTYDISGATITRVGSVLTILISTNFAGHAGAFPSAGPNGIGYGDLFLSNVWNPFGADSHHTTDNASNGTLWKYGLSLDNRWSNTGGKFTLYNLTGATNAANVKNSETFMSCALGTSCLYRDGQAVAVKTTGTTGAVSTGLQGDWSITADQSIKFTFNMTGSDLINFTSFAMHWGETCQNDVIEGITKMVPEPGTIPLVMLGLGGLLLARRRQLFQR